VTRACEATGETVLVPDSNGWSKGGRITDNSGKSTDRREGGGEVRRSWEAE
jgi:hypothetical protein